MKITHENEHVIVIELYSENLIERFANGDFSDPLFQEWVSADEIYIPIRVRIFHDRMEMDVFIATECEVVKTTLDFLDYLLMNRALTQIFKNRGRIKKPLPIAYTMTDGKYKTIKVKKLNQD